MAIAVNMSKMSDTMTEGVVVKWNVKVGDPVKSGDIIAEVETDKATMDFEVFEKGTILHLAVKEGEAVPVDGLVAVIGEKGEDYKPFLLANKEASKPQDEKDSEVATVPPPTLSVVQPSSPSMQSGMDIRIKASPLAKKLASEKGIDISAIRGSGESGRIIKTDIENFTQSPDTFSAIAGRESFEEINVSQMRKTIANRLAESKFTAPHFYLTMEINMDKAMAARTSMIAMSDVKISVNDMIVKASALALRKHPWVNASWLGTKIRLNHHIHIGVAMAVDEGLLVPVVRFTDQKTLTEISNEIKVYNIKARDKKLQPQDWAGNTFTISNLGMFGIEEFTAIINTPDACILAVGAVKETVGIVNGEIGKTQVMKVTLSCDHRVVDGVVGSKFLKTLKSLLEDPVTMLL